MEFTYANINMFIDKDTETQYNLILDNMIEYISVK